MATINPIIDSSNDPLTCGLRDALLPSTSKPPAEALGWETLERVESWGMNTSSLSYVFRPSTIDGIREAFRTARRHGLKVGLRGGGRSYGDASLSGENVCLDLTRMNRILEWNPATGLIKVEPGVTLCRLWQYIIGDGWWPPVVSGTMFVTMGGAAGMNYHGKNNFRAGPIGDHITEFDLLLPSGEVRTCSRDKNRDLFFAAIGGFGMMGCFTSITIQMKKVHSGLLSVYAFSTHSFGEIMREFEQRMGSADYLVGWIDCFATGKQLGRGCAHQATYLKPGEDPNPAQTLRVENQELPDTLFGFFPKSVMWRFMKPFLFPLGMRLVNWAKYVSGNTLENHKTVRQSHAGFAFLLDYVPNWKLAYKPGGLIQFQSFVPAENAEQCFTEEIQLCQKRGLVPYLGVFKRHKKDAFLMTHSVNGYSLALDFHVTKANRKRVYQLARELSRLAVAAGGRFYPAKDSTLEPETAAAYLGAEAIAKFSALKHECDPENLLQTELSNRLFGDFSSTSASLTAPGAAR